MSTGKDVCVGCRSPKVERTVIGDVTRKYPCRGDFDNLEIGSNGGCRNCAVLLDVITTIANVGMSEELGKQDKAVYQFHRSRGTIWYRGNLSLIQVIRCTDHPQRRKPPNHDAWNSKEQRTLSNNTSSQETLSLIQNWAADCIEHYQQCPQRADSLLPKRILEITADRVRLREQLGSSALYACPSHCWGPDGPAIRLTADTAELLCNGFATCDLPKTFRDAADVCRRLGIAYLWVDALCILQDSQEDWKEAAATMADIYENAHITIAATFAKDSNVGLFSSDRPLTKRLDKHPHLYVKRCPPSFPIYADKTDSNFWPLLTRAWVYQERRLSSRTIHFGKHQVYWECRTHFASEDTEEDTHWCNHTGNIFQCDPPIFPRWGDKMADPTKHWQKIVLEYSKLQLTYESDRLPAIAALANRTSQLLRADDIYIGGMWKNSMVPDLMWTTHCNESRPARSAPSWSWASIQNARISWPKFRSARFAKLISLDYTASGATYLGEAINASIVLRVPVLNLTGANLFLPPRDKDCSSGHNTYLKDWLSSSPYMDLMQRNNLRFGLSNVFNDYDLTTADPPYLPGHVVKALVLTYDIDRLHGLVVRQTNGKPATYERIGSLSIGVNLINRSKSYKPLFPFQNFAILELMA